MVDGQRGLIAGGRNRLRSRLSPRWWRPLAVVLGLMVVAAAPTTAAAERCTTGGGSSYTFCGTLFGNQSAGGYFLAFYYWSVGIATLGATAMIIYAGYKYATSRDQPEQVREAKEIVVGVIVGLALLIMSYSILKFLGINVV